MRSLSEIKTTSVHRGCRFVWIVLTGLWVCADGLTGIQGEAQVIQFFGQSFLPQSVEVTRGGSVSFERVQGEHRVRSGLPDGDLGSENEPGLFFDFVLDETNPIARYTLEAERTNGIAFFDDTVTSGLSSRSEGNPGALFDEESSDAKPFFTYRFETLYFCRPHEFMGPTGGMFVQELFLRGDATKSGDVDISDAISTLIVLFDGRPSRGCDDSLDSNDDGQVAIADVMFTLGFLFESGRIIPPWYPILGADRTGDLLRCAL